MVIIADNNAYNSIQVDAPLCRSSAMTTTWRSVAAQNCRTHIIASLEIQRFQSESHLKSANYPFVLFRSNVSKQSFFLPQVKGLLNWVMQGSKVGRKLEKLLGSPKHANGATDDGAGGGAGGDFGVTGIPLSAAVRSGLSGSVGAGGGGTESSVGEKSKADGAYSSVLLPSLPPLPPGTPPFPPRKRLAPRRGLPTPQVSQTSLCSFSLFPLYNTETQRDQTMMV
jgi:hypothetical protein